MSRMIPCRLATTIRSRANSDGTVSIITTRPLMKPQEVILSWHHFAAFLCEGANDLGLACELSELRPEIAGGLGLACPETVFTRRAVQPVGERPWVMPGARS